MDMNSLIPNRTQKLKELASRLGFMGVGISKAERLDEEAKQLEAWLKKGYHGEMGYMANHFDLRVDPTKLVPGAKSVVSLIYNYFPEPLPLNPLKGTLNFSNNSQLTTDDSQLTLHDSQLTTHNSQFKISKYAYGQDYHKVVRRKLKELVSELRTVVGDFKGRVFVDSAPVMERDWAKRSGQGWIGKNTLLIHPKKGSYFFLAELILDIELAYDHPIRDHCGTCTKCIDACPTEAISPEGYVLDGSKCISYLTIELKSNIPDEFKGKMDDWIFGCDICQEVCPWNRFSKPHNEPAFQMDENVTGLKNEDWLEMTEEVFDKLFSKSPIKRTGFRGLKRNTQFVSNKQ
ncbi:MAG: tRNA epoxyqueuosine(34) reductase QueG [Saprospiraceae bacterium]